jgi:UDP-N-acetylmuramoyl-tripeptide--D-alanyl-D-alanine ligase
MQASIKSFMSNASKINCLILGDMLELGDYSKQEHSDILELVKSYPVTAVYTVGKNFLEIAENYNCQSFLNVEQFCEFLQKSPITDGDVLIKGSRGIQLEKVLSFL